MNTEFRANERCNDTNKCECGARLEGCFLSKNQDGTANLGSLYLFCPECEPECSGAMTSICDMCDSGNPVIENTKGYPASSYRPRCAGCTCKSCGGSGLVVKERGPDGYVDYCGCPAGNAQMDDAMTSRRDREEDWFFERMGREY